MGVQGATVTSKDTSLGVRLEFATEAGPAAVSDLQRRVRSMAENGTLGLMHGPGAGVGRAGRAASGDVKTTSRPRARVEDTANGANVTLELPEIQEADALRARAHAHVKRMAQNQTCARDRSTP